MNSLLKTLIPTLFGAIIACSPLSAMNDADDDCMDDHATSFYLDEDDDIDECSEDSEPWHHKCHQSEFDLDEEEEEMYWNLELDTAWPGQREDYSDAVIR